MAISIESGQGELFRLALEAAPTGMLMIDEFGKIALVNLQLERLFGYDREELIGQPVELLLPARFRARHQGLRGVFWARPSARLMGEGRELFGLRKDGREVPVEIGLNPLSVGDRQFVLSSVSDISARKVAERQREALVARLAHAEAAETFRSVFQQSPIAMAILDRDAKYTHVNSAWTRLLGFELTDLVGKTPADITHPDDRAGDAELLLALASGERHSYSRQKRYVRRDGSIVHVLVNAAALKDPAGDRYYVGQIQDITQSVLAEQAIRALQAELARQAEINATVLANMPQGAVFLIDGNLCCVSANGPSVAELTGCAAEELPGRSFSEVFLEKLRAEMLERSRATLSGRALAFEVVNGERAFEVRTAPILSGEQRPVAALVHLYDITERKRQASLLEAERERFRALVEDAPVGIFEIDATGNILYMNEPWRELTGLTVERARSPAARAAGIHPEDREKVFTLWRDALREGKGYKLDFRYQPDGAVLKRLSTVAAPVRGPNGAVSGFIGITLDVTAQVESKEALGRSLKEKETLLKEIHHRVKNNLQVVGSIIGLQANRVEDSRLQSVFADLRGRIHAIALLHERLYRSSDLGAIDLLDYLEGLVGDAARAAGAGAERVTVRGARVVLGIDEAVSVGLAANELVTNAFKHGGRGSTKPRVLVELALDAQVVILTVADDGPGFPASAGAGRGTTLGLLLLERLAKQLDGELAFSSGPTRATLRFPLRGRS